MKIVCISDTHNQLQHINLPKGDLLLIAGDVSGRGSLQEMIQFNKDLELIKNKYDRIIMTAGNHDIGLQQNETLFKQIITNATVLIDQEITIGGIKIYGSPWQIEFNNWAFNLPKGEALRKKWALIPEDVDVLLTHSPPYGILDKVSPTGIPLGCMDLYKRVWELPKLTHHIMGHIHAGYGKKKIGKVTFINASSCTEAYRPTNKPMTFSIKEKK